MSATGGGPALVARSAGGRQSMAMGMIMTAFLWITGIFVALGTIGIYVGLFGSVLAFIVVNLGITRFITWVRNRQTMVRASKGITEAKSGL